MRRIKMMLMSTGALFLVGLVSAGAASAGGDGRVQAASNGGCDVAFDHNGWAPTTLPPAGWQTDVTNGRKKTGGSCDLDDVAFEGLLTKYPDGDSVFVGTFSFTSLSGSVTCGYSGMLDGSWFWTLHNSTTMSGTPPTGSSPPGEDKYFQLSGNTTRIYGPPLFCPSTLMISLSIRTHEVT